MPQRQHLGIAGLYTDPNPFVATPEGALETANECVIRRVGIAEPRPGFKTASAIGPLDELAGLIAYQSSMLAIGVDTTVKTYLSGGYTVLDEASAQLSWAIDYLRATETRGNLYLATSDKVRRITGTGANQVARGSGVVPPTLLSAKATVTPVGGVVGDDEAVAYRWVIKRRDANGVIQYSAPSAYVTARNTSGTTKDVELIGGWRHAIIYDEATDTGDTLQIYRTEVAGVGEAVGADYFLVGEYPITSTDDDFTVTDTVDETETGVPLYTNDDQEGAEATNWRPPACRDVALYQGSLFFLNQRAHAAKDIDIPAPADWSGDDGGFGIRTVIGTLTNGSQNATTLSVGELTGLRFGQLLVAVLDGGSPVWTWDADSAPIRIVSIGSGLVSLSDDWDGSTTTGLTLIFVDSLRIAVDGGTGRYYPLTASTATLTSMIMQGGASYNEEGTYFAMAGVLAFASGSGGLYINAAESFAARRTLRIEALSALSTLELSASHGEYLPTPLPNHDDTPLTVSAEVHKARIGWSKTNEPDHYLISSFQDFGNSADGLRAVPTRDALWLFKGKGDGIYRLSGAGANSGFRIDLFDSSTYLLHPNLAWAMDDMVYAVTNKGFCAISDAGVVQLSGPIASELRQLETELDHEDTEPGAFGVVNPKAREVIFGVPVLPLGTAGGAGRVYCYNARTGAFTKWFAGASQYSCAAYHIGTRALWFGRNDSGAPRVERLESEEILNADEHHNCVIAAVTTTSTHAAVTIDGGSGWTPEVGDLLTRSTGFGIVTEVTSPTQFTVRRISGINTAGAANAYKRFTALITWRERSVDAPAMLKRWQAVLLHWQDAWGLQRYQLTCAQSANESSQTQNNTYERSSYQRVSSTDDKRALVPRLASLGTRLKPTLNIRQADARWQMAGLTLEFEPVSSRVSR
jgi:hypothetical protein